MVRIELDAFSGRPNPNWVLNEAQARELLALIAGLPAAAPQPPPADLGYRGFLIHRPAAGGVAPAPIRVYGNSVEIDGQAHLDQHGAQAWLLRNARDNGWAAIADSVAPR